MYCPDAVVVALRLDRLPVQVVQTTDTPENKKFVAAYKAKFGEKRVTDDPIEAGYIAVHLWAKAVAKAGTTGTENAKSATIPMARSFLNMDSSVFESTDHGSLHGER